MNKGLMENNKHKEKSRFFKGEAACPFVFLKK